MAGYPPPYPPPPGPYGYDAKQQRRMLRDQAKAQQAAFKAQRDFYKQQQRGMLLQTRGVRRGSILTPLIVVIVGVVLLYIRMGRLSFATFARWYEHWWPLLVVAAGVVLVAEWAIDEAMRSEQPAYRRRTGGAVFLLILTLAVTGIILRGALDPATWTHGFSINPDNFAEFIGDKHEREQTIDQSFPAGASLSIDNPHGDVTITGTTNDNQIHMVAYKQVYSESDSDADAKAQELSPDVQLADGRLKVVVPSRAGGSVDLTVTVPASAQTTVDAGHGDVKISAMRSPVSVTVDDGDVEVSAQQGTVTAHINNRDSSFSAHQVNGDVLLKGNADDLNLSDITGAVTLDGDFYGDTHLEKIGGATAFRTSRTNFSFARLNGTVDISPEAELSAEQVVGPTTLTTRSRNVTLQHFAGDVSVTNSNGSVELSGAAPMGDVSVNNRSGSVTLMVPQGAGFNVEAETTEGDVENDFGLVANSENRESRVSGKEGSGRSTIKLITTHGDVALRKGDAAGVQVEETVAPVVPKGPLTATPTKKGGKHISATVNF